MHRVLLPLAAAFLVVGLFTPIADAADPNPRITTVTPGTITPADDFSSRFRGHFWDFSSEDHLGWETSQALWINPELTYEGWFAATTEPLASNPGRSTAAIRLNNFTEPNSIPVPEEYADTPFDPSYRYLTMRMCATFNDRSILGGKEPDKWTAATVSWHRDAAIGTYEWGVANGVEISEGCGVYQFDLIADQTEGLGNLPWTAGGFTGLRLRPAIHADVEVEIDFVTLTPTPTGAPVTVEWTDNGSPVDLLMDTSPALDRAATVAEGITGGSFVWNTPNLAPGMYYLGLEQDGTVVSGGTVIVNGPPRGEFITPSYTSGPSYADEGLGGNDWDMNGWDDIESTLNLDPATISGGFLNAANAPRNGDYNSDPGVRFTVNSDIPIDPTRFYYLTYRMWVQDSTEPGSGFGTVVRVHWWTGERIGDKFSTTSQDIRDYDGWQQISLDLRGDILEPEKVNAGGAWGEAGPVYALRIDPHESNQLTPFVLDWVTLTANHRVDRTFTVEYNASDPEGDPIETWFFYDTDRDHDNGATAFDCLPLGTPGTCEFATADVPDGDYYLHVKLADPLGNTTWETSDVPIEIRHAAGPTCDGLEPTIPISSPGLTTYGTDGPDVILGTDGIDIIFGGGGDDTICGVGDDDEIYGEDGDDRIWGGSGNDYLHGGDDRDVIYGQAGDDEIHGGRGHDYDPNVDPGVNLQRYPDVLAAGGLNGGSGDDRIFGEGGKDILIAGKGQDYLDGGSQNDRLFGSNDGGETLLGGDANDTVKARGGNGDSLDGGDGIDMLIGSGGSQDCVNGPVFKTCDSPESRVVLDGAPADLVAVMEQLAAWIADPSNPQPPMDAGLAAWIQSAHPKYRWTPMSFNASWAVEGSGPRTAVVHQEFWKRRTFKAGLDILIWHDDGTGWKLTDARLDRFSLGTWGNPDPYRVCDWAGNLNACQGDNPAP